MTLQRLEGNDGREYSTQWEDFDGPLKCKVRGPATMSNRPGYVTWRQPLLKGQMLCPTCDGECILTMFTARGWERMLAICPICNGRGKLTRLRGLLEAE